MTVAPLSTEPELPQAGSTDWVRSGTVSPPWRLAIGALLLYVCATYLCAIFPHLPVPNDTAIYLYRQDRWLLLVEGALLLLSCIQLPDRARPLYLSRRALTFVAVALIVVCYAGGKWITCGYAMSRDEQMAVFDSQVFSTGHLVQALPSFWRAHASALNMLYMIPAAHPIAWISSYLPVNALLRSLVGLIGDPALTGPLMVAGGALALWKCARLIWPDDREAALVALLLYVGSGQVLFAGMTAYAMPAHLALNLVWLWLFLLNRRGADFAALLVGLLATGLHQPAFHPLFAAPILFTLLLERNWKRAALYVSGYAAIAAFWLAWPHWMTALVAGPNPTSGAPDRDYLNLLYQQISHTDSVWWENMAANLLRLFAWQHVLLLPLLFAAIPAIRRGRLPAAFGVSLLLPIGLMAVILPWQGHGFGYRYLQGALGSGILLAVYGWRAFSPAHAWARPLLMRATAGTLAVTVPLQAAMAYGFYEPVAHIDRRISASGADYFIVGRWDVPFSLDLVVNRPDLSNRPVRLYSAGLNDQLIRTSCRNGARIAMPTAAFLRPVESYYLVQHSTAADDRIAVLSPRLKAAGCTVEYLDAR